MSSADQRGGGFPPAEYGRARPTTEQAYPSDAGGLYQATPGRAPANPGFDQPGPSSGQPSAYRAAVRPTYRPPEVPFQPPSAGRFATPAPSPGPAIVASTSAALLGSPAWPGSPAGPGSLARPEPVGPGSPAGAGRRAGCAAARDRWLS
jgi:hypothetical protein